MDLHTVAIWTFTFHAVYSSDRLGVTMHPAQPDWTFDKIVKV